MKKKLPAKPLDFVILLAALALAGFSAYRAYARPADSLIMIRGSGREWVYPLDARETVIVPGPLGNTVITIGGGYACVESSPCLNQVCVSAGRINRQGAWTACLPNNVLLFMGGTGETNQVDAVVW